MALLDRRSFLKSAGAAFAAALSPQSALALQDANTVFASAYKAPDGSYGIATLSEAGSIIHRYALPDRGHDIVRHPSKYEMVAFARRPGTFAVVINCETQAQPKIINSVEGRHFYGHGLYSADGRFLFATENDYENARGVIGVYEANNNYRRIGELDAFGVGPHDMELLPDGKTIVVANGGIETHPDFPRTKLNLSTMQPNLTFIDVGTGALKAKFELSSQMSKLSIRHLAMLGDTVWFACQNQGDLAEPLSLIGSVQLSTGEIKTTELPKDITVTLRGYVGSIAANTTTGLIGFTSPRGGIAYQLDPVTDKIVFIFRGSEVCGVAANKNGFSYSTGEGQFVEQQTGFYWDNHICCLRF